MNRRRPHKIFAWISIAGLAAFLFMILGGGYLFGDLYTTMGIAGLSLLFAVLGALLWFLDAVACALIDATDQSRR